MDRLGNLKAVAGNIGDVSAVATSQIMGELHVVAKVGITMYYTVRAATKVYDDITAPWLTFLNVSTAMNQAVGADFIAMD